MGTSLLHNAQSTPEKTIKQKLLTFVGILVVVPSIINAGSDIYKAVLDLPIGEQEHINSKLKDIHWDELAILKKDFDIKKDGTTRVLRIRVYQNADIWTKYGKEEQWLPYSDKQQVATNSFPFSSTAYAGEAIHRVLRRTTLPIFSQELTPAVVDINAIVSEKEELLSQTNSSIKRIYLFNQKNNSNTGLRPGRKKYVKTFSAEKGFIFTDAKIDVQSRSNASIPVITFSPDKKQITVSAEVGSGPIYDQWNGWIKADILTKQQKNAK